MFDQLVQSTNIIIIIHLLYTLYTVHTPISIYSADLINKYIIGNKNRSDS